MRTPYTPKLFIFAVIFTLFGCTQQYDVHVQLNHAAKNGDTGLVHRLLDQGANVNARDRQFNATPLMWAAHEGHAETLKLLIERGAEIELVKEGSKTALWYAAEQGRSNTALLLIQRGANPNAKSSDGITVLNVAQSGNHIAVVELLRKAGATK
jgi:ankyrin repeat protein